MAQVLVMCWVCPWVELSCVPVQVLPDGQVKQGDFTQRDRFYWCGTMLNNAIRPPTLTTLTGNAITAAGQQGVEALASGPWDPERWSDLLEQSRHFATASGMLSETKRLRVYNTVLNEIGLAGLQSNYAVRLCMLGNSVAVVPRKLEKPCETEHLDALAKQLDTHGISAFITRFGPLTHGA